MRRGARRHKIRRMAQIIFFNGVVGVAMDFTNDWAEPKLGRTIFLSATPMDDVRGILEGGERVEHLAGHRWMLADNTRRVIDCAAGQVYDTKPLAKPRRTAGMKRRGAYWAYVNGDWKAIWAGAMTAEERQIWAPGATEEELK